MGFLPLLFILALSSNSLSSPLPSASRLQHLPRSSCPASGILDTYWPSWKSQTPAQIPWSDVTNFAVYFVAGTTADPASISMPDGEAGEFVVAAHKAGKKALLSVGGWDGSYWFSGLMSNSYSRTTFAKTIYNAIVGYGFDGADIDWEFPGSAGAGNPYSSADAQNFLSFLAVLRSTLGKRLITLAIPGTGWAGSDGNPLTNTAPYAAYVDYVTLMAYDQWGPWLYTTGPGSPMATCNSVYASGTSVPNLVNYWVNSGFPACQILLGIATYSSTYVTISSTLSTTYYDGKSTTAYQSTAGPSQPADPQYMFTELISHGPVTSLDVSYPLQHEVDVSHRLVPPEDWDTCTSTPYLFNPQSHIFITYEDAQSTGIKAQWAETHGLAGVTLYDSAGLTAKVLAAVKQGLSGADASTSIGKTGGLGTSTQGLCGGTTGQTCYGSTFGNCCSVRH
ncbi:chitinase, partial [Phenoliferia sp. Uapishka_3]